MRAKLLSTMFLVTIALVPIAIVAAWDRMGAIWVAGYAVGIVTGPVVGIGALRALSAVFDETKALVAAIVFGCSVIVISLAAATYALMR
jgi:hypothetical protein